MIQAGLLFFRSAASSAQGAQSAVGSYLAVYARCRSAQVRMFFHDARRYWASEVDGQVNFYGRASSRGLARTGRELSRPGRLRVCGSIGLQETCAHKGSPRPIWKGKEERRQRATQTITIAQ